MQSMNFNLLMLSWTSAYLCEEVYQALLCCSGVKGFFAFKESLTAGYPAHSIYLTVCEDPSSGNALPLVDLVEQGKPPCLAGRIVGYRAVWDTWYGPQEDDDLDELPTDDDRLFLDYFGVPQKEPLHLQVYTNLKTLPAGFMSKCPQLTTINLSGVCCLENLPLDFLQDAENLRELDLTFMANVVTPAENEPAHLSDAASLFMQPQSGFLYGCKCLRILDLSPLSNIRFLPEGFLCYCSGLETINLAPLCDTHVSSWFLFGCERITSLDVSPLSRFIPSTLPIGFLEGLAAVEGIDMTPLTNVKWLPDNFLFGNTSMRTLQLPPNLEMTHVGLNFLSGCASLTSVDLRPLRGVRFVECKFLYGCESLTHVDLSPLSEVRDFPSVFLAGCKALTEVDISSWLHLYRYPEGLRVPQGCVVKLPPQIRSSVA